METELQTTYTNACTEQKCFDMPSDGDTTKILDIAVTLLKSYCMRANNIHGV